MEKTTISSKQAISIMVVFLVGSTSVLGFGDKAKQEYWICLLIAIAMSIPLVLLYSQILTLFPGKSLYDIAYIIFGKIGGAIITLIFVLFSIQLGAIVTRNFTEFIQIISLDKTPQIIVAAFLLITCFLILRNGIEVLGRISIIFLYLIIIVLVFTFIFLTKDMHPENLKPYLEQDFKTLFLNSIPILVFPFGDSVIFLNTIPTHLHPTSNVKKIFILCILITGVILLIALFRNILVLGIPTLEMLYFPSYSAVSKLNIGEFFSRAEILLATNFLMAGIIKTSVCLYSATKGIAKLFKIENHKSILAPVTLFMLSFSSFIFSNIMQNVEFNNKTTLYFIIIQIIIPLIIYIFAVIKVHFLKKQNTRRVT